jgi:hypothetical protein
MAPLNSTTPKLNEWVAKRAEWSVCLNRRESEIETNGAVHQEIPAFR